MDHSLISWKDEGMNGAVAAGGSQAVAAGLDMLSEGGNAVDAAVATILALGITDFGFFAHGGEAPFMVYDAESGRVRVLSGMGRAPLSAESIRWYYENGIPSNGDIKAAAVPCVIDLCVTALVHFGTMSFAKVIEPARALLAGADLPWQERLSETFDRLVRVEKDASGTREKKLEAVADRFYRGDIAEELERWYLMKGGFLRREDLASFHTLIEDPVTAEYRGYSVCKCGPWTQGPYLLQTLRLLEGYNLQELGHLSVDYIHVLAEALKLGLADRDEYYGDPLFVHVPMQELLSDKYTALRRPLIDMDSASTEVRAGDPLGMKAVKQGGLFRPSHGGTTTCVVADRWGNMVAATPSCNIMEGTWEPGSTGFVHGNRLRSLNTNRNHPNRIEAGKRPRITLTPTLVLKGGEPVAAISVAGGDLQDQTALNVLLNHIEFDMAPGKAVTSPRFSTGHYADSFDPNPDRLAAVAKLEGLNLNMKIKAGVRTGLEHKGHSVTTTEGAIARPVMLQRDPATGMLYAAGDPEAERCAGALK